MKLVKTNISTMLIVIMSLLTSACDKPVAVQETVSQAENLPTHTNPSFDCKTPNLSQVELEICNNPDLAMLDRQLALVYKQAIGKVEGDSLNLLKAMQRGWIKGRDECWKSEQLTLSECTAQSYQDRIAELQVKYELLPSTESVIYCEEQPYKIFKFADLPEVIKVVAGEQILIMKRNAGAGQEQYQGRNQTYQPGPPMRWQKQFQGEWLNCHQ